MTTIVSGSDLQKQFNDAFEYRDGEIYWKIQVTNTNIGDIAGSKFDRYRNVRLHGKTYQVGRVIFIMFNGVIPEVVDHINGDTFDNRIENLRAATFAENNRNRKISNRNTTGVKGISFNARVKKYKAQITVNYKQIHLGYFKDLELARLVINEARNKYHKNFACNGVR